MSSEFQKLPECDRCSYYTGDFHLYCTVHPFGANDGHCKDFQYDVTSASRFEEFLQLPWVSDSVYENPWDDSAELWMPDGAYYQQGELLISQALRQRWQEIDETLAIEAQGVGDRFNAEALP